MPTAPTRRSAPRAAALLAATAAGSVAFALAPSAPTPSIAAEAPAPPALGADTSGSAGVSVASGESSETRRTAPEADRQAILAMAGAFRVSFTFRETVALAEAYELRPPYETNAVELVEVIADEDDFISLQHILLVGADGPRPTVVKHWRQDWRYQDRELLVYAGHDCWRTEQRPAEAVRGTWSQSVHQTTDAPRYEAIGRWTHGPQGSWWESEITWRPLPRREHTVRDDYDVILGRNRHALTPDGWVHEQDNLKVVLDADGGVVGSLARETGVNVYERTDPAAVEPARRYWQEHAEAWATVRHAWTEVLAADQRTTAKLLIRPEAVGPPLPRVIDVALENERIRATLVERLRRYVEAG